MSSIYSMIHVEHYRCPLRLELVRHVIPLILFVAVVATGLGYGWAKNVYTTFQRGNGQPISSTSKMHHPQNNLMGAAVVPPHYRFPGDEPALNREPPEWRGPR